MSTEYASADDFLTPAAGQDGEDFTLPSGRKVRVRGLTRYELMHNGKGTDDSLEIERRNVSCCLIEPRMTPAQVGKWQKADQAGGDLAALSVRIRDLSGLGEGAQKSDVDGDGDGGA